MPEQVDFFQVLPRGPGKTVDPRRRLRCPMTVAR